MASVYVSANVVQQFEELWQLDLKSSVCEAEKSTVGSTGGDSSPFWDSPHWGWLLGTYMGEADEYHVWALAHWNSHYVESQQSDLLQSVLPANVRIIGIYTTEQENLEIMDLYDEIPREIEVAIPIIPYVIMRKYTEPIHEDSGSETEGAAQSDTIQHSKDQRTTSLSSRLVYLLSSGRLVKKVKEETVELQNYFTTSFCFNWLLPRSDDADLYHQKFESAINDEVKGLERLVELIKSTESSSASDVMPPMTVSLKSSGRAMVLRSISDVTGDTEDNFVSQHLFCVPDIDLTSTELRRYHEVAFYSLAHLRSDSSNCDGRSAFPTVTSRPYPQSKEISHILANLTVCVLFISDEVENLQQLCVQLVQALIAALGHLKQQKMVTFTKLQSFYYENIPNVPFPLSVAYRDSSLQKGVFTDDSNVSIRQLLHSLFALPSHRAFFQIRQSIDFRQPSRFLQEAIKGKLRNVHEQVPRSKLVKGGDIQLTQGSYYYFHYLHENFDDKGWGCAYRCLQTLVTWFCLQHYGSLSRPLNIPEMQKMIREVDPHSKTSQSIVGSQQWIGSSEIVYILEYLFGIECQQLHVRSGAEITDKGRILQHHFKTQGTPVMIGGGEYAYLILGVDYNYDNKDLALLILDPHYTGNDEISAVIAENGGGCYWQRPSLFFKQSAFYNLCLPRIPQQL